MADDELLLDLPRITAAQCSMLLLVSGKRKSGKDYACARLLDQLSGKYGQRVHVNVVTIAAPVKEMFARLHRDESVDYARLLDASHYKELYRLAMIKLI
jgi:phosphomevalonate kinase